MKVFENMAGKQDVTERIPKVRRKTERGYTHNHIFYKRERTGKERKGKRSHECRERETEEKSDESGRTACPQRMKTGEEGRRLKFVYIFHSCKRIGQICPMGQRNKPGRQKARPTYAPGSSPWKTNQGRRRGEGGTNLGRGRKGENVSDMKGPYEGG